MTDRANQLSIILVPHTHWDREWYQTFQQFRLRLVHAINRLLDILDQDPNFSHFMLDGQTIILDDYLEIEPGQEGRLKHSIRAGRIQIGPWYLQPDEFLVSGESLIRNLQIGLQQCAEFGATMSVGYVPDTFGHIAQLPQILWGFGIDNAIFWRGVGAEAEKSEFFWESPDGTKVLVFHLADPVGYSNARMMPLAPEAFATRVELLAAQILSKATTNTLLFMNGSDHLEPQEGLPATIEAANTLLAHINPRHEKILTQFGHPTSHDGTKHYEGITVRIGTLPQYIEEVRRQQQAYGVELQTLRGEMRSSQYAHLLPAVLSTRIWIKQANTAIEHLLEHEVEPLTAWAWKLGTPYPEGLVRMAWKHLLQNHPHDSICGCSIDQVHRENAVRFAQSQQIAEGAITLATQAIVAATSTKAQHATASAHSTHAEAIPIVVFNMAPGPRTEAIQVVVQSPGSLRNAVIVDERGNHMPFSVVNRWRQEIGSMPMARETIAAALALVGSDAPGTLLNMAESTITTIMSQPEGAYVITNIHLEEGHQPGVGHIEILIAPRGQAAAYSSEVLAAEQQWLALLKREDITTLDMVLIDQARETLDVVAADLPAYGLKTFHIYPEGLKEDGQPDTQQRLIAQQNSIENEYYHVEVSAEDGTLTVTDKQTGAIFPGLNRFVDSGDVGDLYTYCPPEHDTIIHAPVEPPQLELVHAGPVQATLRITSRWQFPYACTDNRAERSSQTTDCTIISEVSLIPGMRRIDLHTRIHNKARDHRLRVLFPVPFIAEEVTAEGTFEVRTRPIAVARPADVAEWIEEPINAFPQKRFVAVSNGQIGLGILNRGLPECEVLREGVGITGVPAGGMAVAITLLRCIGWLSRGDLATRRGHAGPMEQTPEAQCLGEYTFDYALVPHSGDWEANETLVLREAQAFNVPVRAVVTDQHEGQLPSLATLVEVEPRELVVSAVRRSNDGKGIIVRVYNPLARAVEAMIRPGFAASRAFVTNLQEKQEEQLLWNGDAEELLHVGVRARGIMTIEFL